MSGFVHLGFAKSDPQWALYRREGDPRLRDGGPRPSKNGRHTKPAQDWAALLAGQVKEFTPALRRELAGQLGLPEVALCALEIGHCAEGPHKDEGRGPAVGPCWTFPEEDGSGHVVGILCRYRCGTKKAWPGCNRGLTVPAGWRERPGPVFLPEGPSDVLAFTAVGLAALGRPSNQGGVNLLAKLLADLPRERPPVIVAEYDPNEQGKWPGRDGAEATACKLASLLGRQVYWTLPPDRYKDVRAWVVGKALDPTCIDLWDAPGEQLLTALQGKRIKTTGSSKPTGRPVFDAEPRAIRADLLPVPALDLSMLPVPFRGWLGDIASRGCFPLEYPAGAAIVATGALVGKRLGIRPKRHDDWLVIPNQWGGVVGHPGIQKTPPVEEAMRPLRRLVAEEIKKYQEALREHTVKAAVAKARADAAKDALKKAAKSKKCSDEELRALAGEAEPVGEKPPTLRRYETNDPTVEKLGELLAENPRGILLFRDELMGFLRNLEKQGHESDRAFYLEAWSGTGCFTYDRIGRGTLHIPNVCVSIVGTIQPGPLARYVRTAAAGDNDGLINRFQILLYPDPPGKWSNIDRYPSVAEKNSAFKVFRFLDNLDPSQIGAEKEDDQPTFFLRFAASAQEYFDPWRSELENRLRSDDETTVLRSHLAKYRSLMPSLALLFHLVDVAGGQGPGPVTLRAAETAAAWCCLLEAHARRVYQAAFDGDSEPALRLARRIHDSLPNPFKARDVQRKCWSGLDRAEEVERALFVLEDHGWLKSVDVPAGPEGGRPTKLYHVHPAIIGDAVSVLSGAEG